MTTNQGMSGSLPQMELVTKSLARASVKRARKSLEDAAAEVVWQIEREVWIVLGYRSWTEMREAEYGGAAFMVPSKSRPEIVARIKQIEVGKTARGGSKHLTDREIANTAGVSRAQVQDDLNGNNKKSSSGQNVESSAYSRPQSPMFGPRRKHAQVVESMTVTLQALVMVADEMADLDDSMTAEESVRFADDLARSLRALGRLKKNLYRKAAK